MTISAVSNFPYRFIDTPSPLARSWRLLAEALKSGNATAAQQAYSDIAQQGTVIPGGQNGQLGQLFRQIGADLQAGDLNGAQQALQQYQQPTEETSHRRRHHHRHHGDTTDAKQPASANASQGSADTMTITESVSVTVTVDISVDLSQST